MRVERLTYVHHGDSGSVGLLISEMRGLIRFNDAGSGLLDVKRPPSTPPGPGDDIAVRIVGVTFSTLPYETQQDIGEQEVPCILAHAGTQTVVVVPCRSLARITGGASDLRGKVRYGLARIGWDI